MIRWLRHALFHWSHERRQIYGRFGWWECRCLECDRQWEEFDP